MNSALNSVSVFTNSTLSFRKVSAFSKSTLRISIFSSKDDASRFDSQSLLLQPSLWSTRTEGGRIQIPHQRRNVFSVPAKEDKRDRSSSSSDHESSKSSGQEEIIALFKRIQASIAKDGLTSTQKRSSNSNKEKTTKRSSGNYKEMQSSESVLDILEQSRRQGKVRRVTPKRRGVFEKESRTENNSSTPNFKLTRLPSNFVKRSPIPIPSTREVKAVEVIREQLPNAVSERESGMQRVEETTVPELKELAKSRGVKGYSKLKKGELVALLKGF